MDREQITGVPDRFSRMPAIILALIGLAALSIASWEAVRIPGAPYNVSELFPRGHDDASAILFAAFLLFGGFAPAWVAGRILKNPRWSLGTPVWAAMVTLGAWALLRLSVTTESIGDILGSPVLRWGWDWEYICRFLALYGGPAIILIAASAAVGTTSRSGTYAGIQTGLGLLFTNLPLLLLVHFVVIEWACTDNLTELIRDDPYPGDVFLMVLVLLVGLNAAAVAHTWRSPRAGACLLALIATPILALPGWLLLDAALAPQLEKYGITFPAVRFLLGPDRQTNLSEAALLLRWTLVYMAAVLALAYGQLVALMLQPRDPATSTWAHQEQADRAREFPRTKAWQPAQGDPGRGCLILLLAYLAFVVYGSLVPLNYRAMPFDAAVSQFLRAPYLSIGVGGRADLVANLLLFIPLTFLAMGAFTRENVRRHRLAIAVVVVAAAVMTSVAIEFTQVYFPARTVSQNDMMAESAGGVIGIVVWFLAGARITTWAHSLWQEHVQGELAVKILGGFAVGFAVYQLLPFDLALAPQEIFRKFKSGRVNLVPFGDPGGLDFYDMFSTMAAMLPIGHLFALLLRRTRRPLWMAIACGGLFAAGIEFLQLFVMSRFTNAADVILGTFGAALGAWSAGHLGSAARQGFTDTAFWTRHGRWIKCLLALGWLAGLVWFKWYPFEFEWPPEGFLDHASHSIHVPLVYLYYQSELSAAAQVAREFIVFAVIGMLLKSLAGELAGRRLAIVLAASVTAAIAIGLEAGQLFLHSRGADMASVLIPIVSGIGGAFLCDPFVTTFIKGSGPSRAGSEDWQST